MASCNVDDRQQSRGISSWELHRALGVTQKTAWFMLHRIRLAMQDELIGGSLDGEVEIMRPSSAARCATFTSRERAECRPQTRKARRLWCSVCRSRGKTVRATVIPDRTKPTIQPIVAGNVEPGAQIHSDEHGYNWQLPEYPHEVVNHLPTSTSKAIATPTALRTSGAC